MASEQMSTSSLTCHSSFKSSWSSVCQSNFMVHSFWKSSIRYRSDSKAYDNINPRKSNTLDADLRKHIFVFCISRKSVSRLHTVYIEQSFAIFQIMPYFGSFGRFLFFLSMIRSGSFSSRIANVCSGTPASAMTAFEVSHKFRAFWLYWLQQAGRLRIRYAIRLLCREIVFTWCCIVEISKNGLDVNPKNICAIWNAWMTVFMGKLGPKAKHKTLKASRSPFLTPTCRKAYLISAIMAIECHLNINQEDVQRFRITIRSCFQAFM